jgi:GTP cyclohydrolase I
MNRIPEVGSESAVPTNGELDFDGPVLYQRGDVYHQEVSAELATHVATMIDLLGEDIEREGLQKTPLRVAKALAYMTQGYSLDPKAILRSALFEEDYSEIILVKDIEIYSLCEHHMLPFFGKAHVAYIPN